ncbi:MULTISPECIES: YpfB family protein [Bacillus]|uniref:YpfB family protein n=1 Tax=Bacillus TaxID=1386 RepID=UPI0002ECA033|nr:MULTISPECIES: YpfB family protein [Bacillus]
MKRIEGIIIKLLVIQAIFLLFFQVVFHREDSFLELKKLAKYEGVYFNNYDRIVDVLQNNSR